MKIGEIARRTAAYRDAIAELTERIEALTAKRTILAAQLCRAACRTSSVTERDDSNKMIADLRDLPVALPEPLDDGATDYLVGRPAPPLGLLSTACESVSLHELGPGLTILYLYPLTGRRPTDRSVDGLAAQGGVPVDTWHHGLLPDTAQDSHATGAV